MTNSDVPAPVDAVRLGQWESRDGQTVRYFHGTLRGEQVPVEIVGLQHVDGRVSTRKILVGNERVELNPASVHELIWMLADASNEVEQLAFLSGQSDCESYADLLRDVNC